MSDRLRRLGRVPHLSFTGINDATNIRDLMNAAVAWEAHGLNIEWGVLYYIEKEGRGRNPTFGKMMEFADRIPCAAHLCGELVFRQILSPWTRQKVLGHLKRFDRVQVNINARDKVFTNEEVTQVYDILSGLGTGLILQYHGPTAPMIEKYFDARPSLSDLPKGGVTILYDYSRGKGVVPEQYDLSALTHERYRFASIGIAGGLDPENFASQRVLAAAAAQNRHTALLEQSENLSVNSAVYYDMESGVQQDPKAEYGVLDIGKVNRVCRRYMDSTATWMVDALNK